MPLKKDTFTGDEVSGDSETNHQPEPSDAWIWIILALLAIIVLFFVFGGGRLIENIASGGM